MPRPQYLSKILAKIMLGASAFVFAAARMVPSAEARGPVLTKAIALVSDDERPGTARSAASPAANVATALGALSSKVRPLSRPEALADAFRSYFAFLTEHPDQVRKPYLYFVDYGLPSAEPRGYVFDMRRLAIVEGPFTVAHGRGSATSRCRAAAIRRTRC